MQTFILLYCWFLFLAGAKKFRKSSYESEVVHNTAHSAAALARDVTTTDELYMNVLKFLSVFVAYQFPISYGVKVVDLFF